MLFRSRYDADFRFRHAEVLQPDAAAAFIALAEMLWAHSVDFDPWWAARPDDHRETTVA